MPLRINKKLGLVKFHNLDEGGKFGHGYVITKDNIQEFDTLTILQKKGDFKIRTENSIEYKENRIIELLYGKNPHRHSIKDTFRGVVLASGIYIIKDEGYSFGTIEMNIPEEIALGDIIEFGLALKWFTGQEAKLIPFQIKVIKFPLHKIVIHILKENQKKEPLEPNDDLIFALSKHLVAFPIQHKSKIVEAIIDSLEVLTQIKNFNTYFPIFKLWEKILPVKFSFDALKKTGINIPVDTFVKDWLDGTLSSNFITPKHFALFATTDITKLSIEQQNELLKKLDTDAPDLTVDFFERMVEQQGKTFEDHEPILTYLRPYIIHKNFNAYKKLLLSYLSDKAFIHFYLTTDADVSLESLESKIINLDNDTLLDFFKSTHIKYEDKRYEFFKIIENKINLTLEKEADFYAYYNPIKDSPPYTEVYKIFLQEKCTLLLQFELSKTEIFPENIALIKKLLQDESTQKKVLPKLSFIEIVQYIGIESVYNILIEKLQESLQKDIDFVVFDLEYRHEKLMELAYHYADSTSSILLKKNDYEDEFLSLLKETSIVIGHNIIQYDLVKIEQSKNLKMPLHKIWDTLKIQAFLTPFQHSLALETKHNAKDDVKLTLKLFITQVLECITLPNEIYSTLAKYIPSKIKVVIDKLRMQLPSITLNNQSFFKEQYQTFFKQKSIHPYVKKIRNYLKNIDAKLIIIHSPDVLIDIWKGEQGIYYLSKKEEESTQLIDITKLQALQNTDAAFWIEAALYACAAYKEKTIMPQYVQLGAYLRTQLEQHISSEQICVYHSFSIFSEGIWVGTTETLLANRGTIVIAQGSDLSKIQKKPSSNTTTKNSDYVFINIAPKLRELTEKIRIKTLDYEALIHLKGMEFIWKYFSGGKSLAPLEKAKHISGNEIIHPYLEQCDQFWLEKEELDVYHIWGKPKKDTVKEITYFWAIEDISHTLLSDSKASKPTIYKNNTAARITRVASTSLYRDIYWLTQVQYIRSIIYDSTQPVIWFVKATIQNKAELIRYLKRKNYYIPSNEASLLRQLELLALYPKSKKLCVFDVADLEKVILNSMVAYHFVLDSFELDEIWYLLNQPKHIKAYKEAVSDDPEINIGKIEEEDILEESDAIDDSVASVKDVIHPVTMRGDIGGLLQELTPYIEHLHFLVSNQHNQNQLSFLDARLDKKPFIANLWKCTSKSLVSWINSDSYKADLKEFRQFIPQQKIEKDIDIEKSKEIIRKVFINGHDFYDHQKPYIDNILPAKTDLLISLPTGGGKSILFQGPALYLGSITNKLTLVITPLKALMEDQVNELQELGFWSSVEYINSDKGDEVYDIYQRIAGGEINLLYVTPERFRSRAFETALSNRIEASGGLQYMVFDEAHCISHWGNEFRPDYYYAARQCWKLKKAETMRTPLLLFSATISAQIFQDLNQIFK